MIDYVYALQLYTVRSDETDTTQPVRHTQPLSMAFGLKLTEDEVRRSAQHLVDTYRYGYAELIKRRGDSNVFDVIDTIRESKEMS